MAQTISIGKQDFLYLRENNYFYIDHCLRDMTDTVITSWRDT